MKAESLCNARDQNLNQCLHIPSGPLDIGNVGTVLLCEGHLTAGWGGYASETSIKGVYLVDTPWERFFVVPGEKEGS